MLSGQTLLCIDAHHGQPKYNYQYKEVLIDNIKIQLQPIQKRLKMLESIILQNK